MALTRTTAPGNSGATSMTIKELSGMGRTLTLFGRALPYRPITFSGTMRAEFSWYPGNPEATAQMLGAAEDETSMHGMWKDRFLGGVNPTAIATIDGNPITTVSELAKRVDDFRRQGQLLEVTWDSILRQGIMTKFAQTWLYHTDMEWEMVFTWTGQGDTPGPAVLALRTDFTDVSAVWSADKANYDDATANVGILGQVTALADKFTETLATFTRDLDNGVNDINSAVANTVDSVLDPIYATRRVIGVLSGLTDEAGQLIQDMGNHIDRYVYSDNDATIAALPAGKCIAASKYKRRILVQAQQVRYNAAQQQADLSKQLNPNIIGAYVARADTDLRIVSNLYYGTPDEWRTLQAFNYIVGSVLAAGDVVFIPQLRASGV